MYAGLAQCSEVGRGQFTAAKTVKAGGDADAALGSVDQHFLQLIANLVFKDDEGFQENFTLGLTHGLEDTREISFAVFQQFHAIVALPTIFDIDHTGFANRRRG